MMNTMRNKKILHLILLYLAIFIAIIGSITILRESLEKIQKGALDQRNRVVGGRLLAGGLNPYFYHWKNGDPEKYIDAYDSPETVPNRVTVPPSLLIIQNVLDSHFSYRENVFFWYVFQWIVMLSTTVILINFVKPVRGKVLMLVVALLFFSSHAWYSSLVAGQIYSLYIFLFSLCLVLSQKKKETLSVIIIAFLVLLRPFYVLFSIPLFFYKKKYFAKFTFYLLIMFFSTVILSGSQVWFEYARSMYEHTKVDRLAYFRFPLEQYYPQTVEGFEFLKDRQITKFPRTLNLNMIFRSIGIEIPSIIFVFITLAILFWFIRKLSKTRVDTFEKVLFYGLFLELITESSLTILRHSYYDLHLLIFFALFLSIEKMKNIQNSLIAMLFLYVYIGMFTASYLIFILVSFMFLGTILFYILGTMKPKNKNGLKNFKT